jgi:hypothetical protein
MKPQDIIDLKEHYLQQSKKERKVWTDCYKNYISYKNTVANPYLSNLFIPKTHEAVELLAAFLVGKTQNINVEPRGANDTQKAQVVAKLMEYQWERVLKARQKLIVWVKQAILFGNGIMKVGWNVEDGKDEPFMQPIGLDSVFMDYYSANIDETPVIHRIVKNIDAVKKDPKYNKNKASVVSISEYERELSDTKFGNYDNTQISQGSSQDSYTEIYEYLYKDELVSIAPTSFGWRQLREVENPYRDSDDKACSPFVKVRFKNSPLPNRAYDTGAIEPALDIQKAFNDMVNEYSDNVSLINNKQWIMRKTANIDPKSLVRRPGGIIKVNDINADIRAEEVGDIKPSALQMLQFLDNEFQQASMVVNLLKAIGDSGTATEAAIGQQNVQTLLDMIEGNIKDAMSELGTKLVDINIQNMGKVKSVKVLDNEKEYGFMDIGSETIKGSYDIKISADRGATEGKAVRQKQLLDFYSIVAADPMMAQKYPELTTQISKKWLEEAGFKDMDFFFKEAEGGQPGQMPGAIPGQPAQPGMPTPDRSQGLTYENIVSGASAPNLAGKITY